MSFQKISSFFLALSAVLIVACIVILIKPGPKFSIEFTGGTLMEVQLPTGKTKADLADVVKTFKPPTGEWSGWSVSAIKDLSGGSSFAIRMRPLSNEEHVALLDHLKQTFPTVQELQFNTIGPSVSASLKQRTFVALGAASLAIITYLAFSFRKLPRKLSPWKFGFLAVLAFLHDVVITAGVFVLIGQFTSFEFDTLFVTALLTILAYSTNDTIVIFDRIRANLSYDNRSENFAETAARGLKQSVTRTMNTMMSVLIMLFSLYFLGSESIRWFILALIFGMLIGTYSSYFIASALLIRWQRNR
jgi:preprotein translocase SecF subunit